MRAVRVHEFGGPEVLRVETVDDLVPSSSEVLVRVHAAGINPVDTYIRAGTYAVKPPLPYTPGFDGAGVVEEVGSDVTGVEIGSRVYFGGTATGSYAELSLCDPSQLYPLPDNLSYAGGASVAVPYGTAHRALFDRACARPGERILVHGATGGVGTAAVQIARAHGLEVFGTGGTKEGRHLVKECGAHTVLDHRAPDYLERLMELTHGDGVDIILEMLANENLGKDLTVLARRGRVVVIGSRGTVEINPRDAMARDASIVGMVLLTANAVELAATHHAIYAGLENGSLAPVVAAELSLDAAPDAHRRVMEPGARGNLVLGL